MFITAINNLKRGMADLQQQKIYFKHDFSYFNSIMLCKINLGNIHIFEEFT